jgi:hypothetical protein
MFWCHLFVVQNKGELYGIAKAMNVTYSCMFVVVWLYNHYSQEYILKDLRKIKDANSGRYHKSET